MARRTGGHCAAVGVFALLASTGLAFPVKAQSERVPAPPPPGFISFCVRHPDQCDALPGEASSIGLTDQRWHAILSVNRQVNESLWREDDDKHYGRPEYWEIPTDGYGDCEDYALAKRKELIDRGLPKLALRIAITVTPRKERHAVLLVDTDRGQYVLDNLTDDIIERRQSDYQWVEEQDPKNARAWVSERRLPEAGTVAAVK